MSDDNSSMSSGSDEGADARMRKRMEAFDDDSGSEEGDDQSSEDNSDAEGLDADEYDGNEGESGESNEGSDIEEDEEDEEKQEKRSKAEARANEEKMRKRASQASAPLFERVAAMQEHRASNASVVSRKEGAGEKVMSARQRNRIQRQKDKESRGLDSASNGSKDSKFVDSRKGIVHRANKHLPSEMSSSKPVSRFREIVVGHSQKRKRAMDPRFNELNGSLSEKHFHNNYKFLDAYQEDEISKLEKAYKKVKSSDTKQVLKQELVGRKQQMKDRRHKLAVQERLAEMKKQEKAKVAAGVKKPFFLKESTKKDIALEEKYSELKKTGELKKYMQKKRLKNAQKDKRWMPESRVAQDGRR